jgi:Zn-finger nucleic acid-binding protein
VKVDVCVNEKCGAMHLDPGELEMIMKDQGGLDKIRKAVFSIFK